jgi:hypothetical protein
MPKEVWRAVCEHVSIYKGLRSSSMCMWERDTTRSAEAAVYVNMADRELSARNSNFL